MNGRLYGHRALVTASAAGIGRACARMFAAEGARVLATDIDAAGLAALHAETPSITVEVMDACSPQAVDDVVRRHGPFDVVLNAVGIVPGGTILETDDALLEKAFDVNVVSMHRVIRAVLPAMLERGGGSIVNIASVASSVKGVPNRYAYGTSKAAIIGLTKAVAADFVTRGIRCNAICPGTVDTPSLQSRLAATGDYAAARAAFVGRQPMGRLGTAEEIAALATYLASNESAFTTGAIHVIDGGWTT
jgi:2-keto-3-deoxy-L-fuconate dehydrogenase